MIRKALLIAVSLIALSPVVPARAQDAPKVAKPAPASAASLLTAAQKRARASNKQVLVVFHASWCGWCKKLDATLLSDPQMAKLLGAQYEIVHLDVMENGTKKSLENPGGDALLKRLGGEKAGLPFYAVLNTSGVKQGDSLRMPENQNIGYPGSPEEIAAFVGLLKSTAPRMTEADRDTITAHLTRNAPKS